MLTKTRIAHMSAVVFSLTTAGNQADDSEVCQSEDLRSNVETFASLM